MNYNGNTYVNIKFIWFLTRFYSKYILMMSPEYNQNNFFWLLFYLSNQRGRIYCAKFRLRLFAKLFKNFKFANINVI